MRPFIRNLPNSPQSLSRQQFTLSDFTGGLNNVDNEALIADNQLCDCKNMMYSDNNSIEKRYGTTYEYENTAREDEREPIIFYDTFKTNAGDEVVITATETKFYVNDQYKLDVNGPVSGSLYNGNYFFTDGFNLYKLYDWSDNPEVHDWGITTVIEDPKFFIGNIKFDDNCVYGTEIINDEELKIVGIEEEYDENRDYYADAYGKVKLEHYKGEVGEEWRGKVDSENYQVYYRKYAKTGRRYFVNINSVYVTYLLPNYSEGVKFKLNTNEVASHTEADVETKIDPVTGLVKCIITTDLVQDEFEIQSIDSENYKITFKTPIKIDLEQFLGEKEWEFVYERIQDDESLSDEIRYRTKQLIEGYLNEKLDGVVGRCYEPRDGTWNDGQIMNYCSEGDGKPYLTWYEPCQNELEYGGLGENYFPSNPKNLTIFKSRLCTTGDYGQKNEIRMTNVNNPLYFPAALSISVNPNGNEVVDMFEFDGALIIGRDKDIYALYGNSSSLSSDQMFAVKKMDANIGMIGYKCGALINNYYIFLGTDGKLYKMTTPTTNVEYLMIKPITTFIDLFKKPLELSYEQMKSCNCVSYKNHIYWLIGDKVLVYSYDNMSFTYFTGWNATCLYTNGLDFFFGDEYGNRCKWNKDVYNDCGKAIKANLRTKTYTMHSPVSYKYFEQMCMTFGRHMSYDSNITMQVFADNRRRVIREVHPVWENSLYDDAQWKINHFAALPYQKTDWMMLNFRSRTISFLFENYNIDESFKIVDCNVIYTGRDIR